MLEVYPKNSTSRTYRSFNGVEEFVESKDYIKRCQNILSKIPRKRIEYQNQIDEYNSQIIKLESMTLKEMIALNTVNDILPKEVCANKLLVFCCEMDLLMRNTPII